MPARTMLPLPKTMSRVTRDSSAGALGRLRMRAGALVVGALSLSRGRLWLMFSSAREHQAAVSEGGFVRFVKWRLGK